MKSKIAKKYVNGKWIFVKKEDILKEVHTKVVDILQKWIDSHRLELTRAMMNSLKDYKLIYLVIFITKIIWKRRK